ncbi:hypothetical protein CPB86DRAFT_790003 [Serendipita vermifera]|nr:hypothetical protein CPB86DRAFT_790003 [Serendipita vermifera]
MASTKQKAIRLHPNSKDIRVDQIPIPEIEHTDDAIVKVELAGLCGSDLHVYRRRDGLAKDPFVMGHELYGEITALGSSFAHSPSTTKVDLSKRPLGYATYKVGQKVIAAFSVSCLECEFCSMGMTSRCAYSQLLGSPSLPGAQAQYIRIPKAGGTLIPMPKAPNDQEELPPTTAILLADILPTGYFAAKQALRHPNLAPILNPKVGELGIGFVSPEYARDISGRSASEYCRAIEFAVIGLGPVGLCALISLVDQALLFLDEAANSVAFNIIAIDLLESRRQMASEAIKNITDKRFIIKDNLEETAPTGVVQVAFTTPEKAHEGTCHAALEVVGHPSSISLAERLSRPFGVISSVGVHTFPNFPIPPPTLYDKNLSFAFGRCPVRAVLSASQEILGRRAAAFEGFVENVVGIEDEAIVKDAYARFDRGECGKICFKPWS